MVWNRCSYQVPVMVGNNASTNKNHKFYNSTVKDISRVGGYYTTKARALCARFFDMGYPVKTQVENKLNKIYYYWGQTIDMSDQSVLTLTDSHLHD